MGRMCESQGAIFDLSPALLHDHSLYLERVHLVMVGPSDSVGCDT